MPERRFFHALSPGENGKTALLSGPIKLLDDFFDMHDYPSRYVFTNRANQQFYLHGQLDMASTRMNCDGERYSDALLERFKNGFPFDWRQLCKEAFDAYRANRHAQSPQRTRVDALVDRHRALQRGGGV